MECASTLEPLLLPRILLGSGQCTSSGREVRIDSTMSVMEARSIFLLAEGLNATEITPGKVLESIHATSSKGVESFSFSTRDAPGLRSSTVTVDVD